MPNPYWPLFDLVIRTPRLEIRLPSDDILVELVRLASAGIHDPEDMPFAIPWTDASSPDLERSALQWWWHQRAAWSPKDWTFAGAVLVDGIPVGVQDLAARDFATLRSVGTGSWLGRAFQGLGIGQEMRAAVLHLAFAGLGAAEAHSGAWHDNRPSLAVSRKLGYEDNGSDLRLRRDVADRHISLRLTRDGWRAGRRGDIELLGLDGCRAMFGA